MRRRRRILAGGQIAGADGTMEGRVRLMLSRSQATVVRQALAAGSTHREVSELLGIPMSRLRARLRDQLHISVGQGRRRRGLPRTPWPDVSPEEIAERAAALRATWTPEREAAAWNSNFVPSSEPG